MVSCTGWCAFLLHSKLERIAMKICLTILGLTLGRVTSIYPQALQRSDVAAIERAAISYIAPSLPKGVIGFDKRTADGDARDSAHAAKLAGILKAKDVLSESVYHCA